MRNISLTTFWLLIAARRSATQIEGFEASRVVREYDHKMRHEAKCVVYSLHDGITNTYLTLRSQTTSNGAFVYVVNSFSNDVSVIKTATNTVVQTVAMGVNPFQIAITPNGAFAYVANGGSNTVSVIDTGTNTVLITVAVQSTPLGVAVDTSGTNAYVANFDSNNLSVISTTTNTIVATIPVGIGPVGMAFKVATAGPTNVDQCKKGGWGTFTNPAFKNQGDCVSFVNRMNHIIQ